MAKTRVFMNRWVTAIVCFFVLVFVANLTLLILARQSEHGLIEDRPYEEGLRYQETIEAMTRAKSLNWSPIFKTSQSPLTANIKTNLHISLEKNFAIDVTKVVLKLKRFEGKEHDHEVELKRSTPQSQLFESTLPKLRSGFWSIEIIVFKQEAKFVWKRVEKV